MRCRRLRLAGQSSKRSENLGDLMTEFHFFHPIEVRYEDVDAQRHVNNVRFFTYMEQARGAYLQHLELWDGRDFDAIGIILVEASCIYKAQIAFGDRLRVGVRCARIGHKSLELVYSIQGSDGREMATGGTVLVAYDYRQSQSVPVSQEWRKALTEFDSPDEG